MSKVIKQMQIESLKQTFNGVKTIVVLSATKLSAIAENQLRLSLRKKNIRLHVIKNSLARRVLSGLGMNVEKIWEGPTTFAWGAGSLAELSRELDELRKKHEKFIKPKGAVSDGQEVTFEQALKMPTKAEAIGRVVMLALAPASRLLSQILGPASQVAGQIKSLREKGEGEQPAAAAPA